jgi:uncharacterized protein (DUF58 family)
MYNRAKMQLHTQIHLNSRLLPALVILAALLQLFDPSPVWAALLVGMGGAWLAGYLWVRELARGLELRREMRFGWAQVGDRLEERFTLTNASWLPALWVEVSDSSDLPGYQSGRVTAVDGRSQTQWRTRGQAARRGVYTLGPAGLHTGDPLGIYRLKIDDPASTSLVVMPPIVPLPQIRIAPGGRTGDGRPRANAPELTVSAAGVREYLPGDSLRWVHWRTSARREDLYVRLPDGTPEGDWWIVLDLNQRVQAGQDWDSTAEHGIILAASLADQGLRAGQAVGFFANSSDLAWLAPREGEGHRWEILRALARIYPGEHSLAELLERSGAGFGQRASLVLITPDTGGEWIKALIPLLWRGIVPTIVLLDPHTFDPQAPAGPAAGLTSALTGLGIAHYVIPREALDRPEARPGQQGQWQFRISPQGRAIPVNQPADTTWKELA